MTTTPILHRLRTALGVLALLPLAWAQGTAHADTQADTPTADGSAQHGSAQAAPTPPAPATGVITRQWVNAQGQREQASATRQTLSGPVMRRVHDRYLKSFETEVPTRLRDTESFGKR